MNICSSKAMRLLAVPASALFMQACTADGVPASALSVSDDRRIIEAEAAADTYTLSFTSAGKWLAYTRDGDILSFDPPQGEAGEIELGVRVTANTHTEGRTASFLLFAGTDDPYPVRVVQKGAARFVGLSEGDGITLRYDPLELAYTADATVRSNIEWELKSWPGWLREPVFDPSPEGGSTVGDIGMTLTARSAHVEDLADEIVFRDTQTGEEFGIAVEMPGVGSEYIEPLLANTTIASDQTTFDFVIESSRSYPTAEQAPFKVFALAYGDDAPTPEILGADSWIDVAMAPPGPDKASVTPVTRTNWRITLSARDAAVEGELAGLDRKAAVFIVPNAVTGSAAVADFVAGTLFAAGSFDPTFARYYRVITHNGIEFFDCRYNDTDHPIHFNDKRFTGKKMHTTLSVSGIPFSSNIGGMSTRVVDESGRAADWVVENATDLAAGTIGLTVSRNTEGFRTAFLEFFRPASGLQPEEVIRRIRITQKARNLTIGISSSKDGTAIDWSGYIERETPADVTGLGPAANPNRKVHDLFIYYEDEEESLEERRSMLKAIQFYHTATRESEAPVTKPDWANTWLQSTTAGDGTEGNPLYRQASVAILQNNVTGSLREIYARYRIQDTDNQWHIVYTLRNCQLGE